MITFNLIDKSNDTGNIYAKITYRSELILMIDLKNLQYTVYDTEYKNEVNTDLASDGIFYVPGLVTTDMTLLYQEDDYARENNIVGIKLIVEDEKISVAYQESPKDLCQLQAPTSSHLRPIVCLPNELVIDIYTSLESSEFIPDSILE
ncbi:NusG domain II-containing protein [Candidatus Izemoplasma sp. B36]|uniref:NusG domain II-containing protein n=1 Tax=Candidatus Izemoplasma sp. B36 TaxID=3242468 RepID=UPI0035580700